MKRTLALLVLLLPLLAPVTGHGHAHRAVLTQHQLLEADDFVPVGPRPNGAASHVPARALT